MLKIIKKIKFFFSSLLLLFVPFALSSCSSNNFYLANFESYMSSELMDIIKDEFSNVNYRYYSSNENLERSFVRNYDVAIPSTYLVAKLAQDDKLEKINWEKFNLKYENNGNWEPIKTADDALNLFNDDVRDIVTNVYCINDKKENLLNYGIPYFLQDMVFGYKGEKIDSLHDNNSTKKIGWNEILDYFGPKIGKGKEYNKIAMIDDYRSIYSIPRLIETKDKGDESNVNPEIDNSNNNNAISIDEFAKTYDIISQKTNRTKNAFLLNSDSGNILNDFTSGYYKNDEFIFNGSDLGIMYNGDLLYSFLGGDEHSDLDYFPFLKNNNELAGQFIRPQKTLIALDMLVINKKSKNKDLAYEVIKKIGLEGVPSGGETEIFDVDEEGNYIYGPMINFEYILYTSPLKSIYDYVVYGDVDKNGETHKYFDYLKEDIDPSQEEGVNKLISIAEEIFKITTDPSPLNMIEKDLSELNKSNMNYGFQKIKVKL